MHRLHIVIVHPLVALGVCVALFYEIDIGESLCTVPGLHRDRAKGVPWNHEQSFFFGGTVTVKKKKGSRGGGNSLRKQKTGTETYGNSTCFPMFPKHVPETLKKNPSLV